MKKFENQKELDFHLVKATIEDHPVIQNMARFYVYEMSRTCGHLPGWECPESGLYECIDLKSYFEDFDRYAFFIKVGEEKAGFVLINKNGSFSGTDWNMGEFFVLSKFQKNGLGRRVAYKIFDQFSGVWEVAAMPANEAALKFWGKVLPEYCKKECLPVHHIVNDKDHPKPHPMWIFRFDSRGS